MNQINWPRVAAFGLAALLVLMVGSGCLVLLLASTAGGNMMSGYGFGGPTGSPWCPGGYGSGYGGMMPGSGGYGYAPFGFLGPLFGLLMMGAVIGVPVLLALLLVGLLAWLVRGAWPPHGGEEE